MVISRLPALAARRQALVAVLLCAGAVPAQNDAVLSPEHRGALTALQPKIDAAVDKGVAWLLSTQQRDGSWPAHEIQFATGQTALSCYTLLKAGLSPDHGAVRRAAEFLAQRRPTKVYAAGCQMLAFGALGAPEYRPQMAAVLADLLDWQQQGGWGYPNVEGRRHLHNDADLSISQFAILGLRAAQQAGFAVPRRVWQRALEAALDYQGREHEVGKGSVQREIAGFHYRRYQGKASGSMTCAGLAVVSLSTAALGERRSRQVAREAARATALGRAWMDHHFSADKNPGTGGWLHYYLYGVERVGALLHTEYFGEHPWYLEGADQLVAGQHTDGHWYSRNSESDTCFAILFLKRATAPATGTVSRAPRMHVAETPESAVWLRVAESADGSSLDMWLTRVGRSADPAPHVAQVDYLIGDEVVSTVRGDPSRVWQRDTYHAKHTFEKCGMYRVRAVVHAEGSKLESKPVEVRLASVLEPWMLEATRTGEANLLRGAKLDARASSQDEKKDPALAVDGRQSTVWVCAEHDASPWLELRLKKAVRATSVVFSPAARRPRDRGHFDRIARVRLVPNGRTADGIEVTLASDEMAPTVVALPRAMPIRQLRIEILERSAGRRKGRAGFAEIALLRTRK